MFYFGSSESDKLRCATTDIVACDENVKLGFPYHSDATTTMCAFKAGVEACYVRNPFITSLFFTHHQIFEIIPLTHLCLPG